MITQLASLYCIFYFKKVRKSTKKSYFCGYDFSNNLATM